MARLPPNQPSRHRSRGRSSQATNRSGNLASESSTANSISRSTCYSSGAQRADTLATLTEDSGSSTPNLIEDSGSSMPTTTPGLLVESTRASCTSRSGASVVSTPTSSRSVTDDLVVPSPPERRSDYLTPLNLSSTINRGGSTSANVSPAFGHDFMAKMEAFFERQKELNDRLEQRVAEHLEKERENLRPAQSRRLPKGISAIVRDVYTSLSGPGGQELRWDLTKSFSDPSNNMVNAAIMDGVCSTDTTTSVNIIRELRDTSTPSHATLREFSTNVQELRMDMMSFIRENSENTTALWKAMQFYTEEVIQLDQKVINISKMQGPRGPPGYNGTQGPAGVSGPPGPPGFNGTQIPGGVSLCSYKESKSTTSSGIYASSVITKDEPNGKKFLGVSCGTNDAKAVTMTSTESKGKRTYKCSCDGTVNTGVSSMYCAIYYWECPT